MEKTKKKLRHSMNYIASPGVLILGDSMTTPDMSYSIPDIIKRFTSGIAPPIQRRGTYDNYSFDIDDPTLLPSCDLSDIEEKHYRSHYDDFVKKTSQEVKKNENKAAVPDAKISENEVEA